MSNYQWVQLSVVFMPPTDGLLGRLKGVCVVPVDLIIDDVGLLSFLGHMTPDSQLNFIILQLWGSEVWDGSPCVRRAAVFSRGPRGKPIPGSFQLLEASCMPWLPAPSSICGASSVTSLTLLLGHISLWPQPAEITYVQGLL